MFGQAQTLRLRMHHQFGDFAPVTAVARRGQIQLYGGDDAACGIANQRESFVAEIQLLPIVLGSIKVGIGQKNQWRQGWR